jgi:hypothetical protein
MTDAGWSAPADLAGCFDLFEHTAWRLETLQAYDVPAERERIAAFRQGQPMPERSVRTSPWLKQIAESTTAGKRWSRTHLLDQPLSEYARFEIATYEESAEAGEVIYLADRIAHRGLIDLDRDFWLFDEAGDHPFAALMTYDATGSYLGADVTGAPEIIARLTAQKRLTERFATPLRTYLERLHGHAA